MIPFDLDNLKKEVFLSQLDGGSEPKVNLCADGEIKAIVMIIDMMNIHTVSSKQLIDLSWGYSVNFKN